MPLNPSRTAIYAVNVRPLSKSPEHLAPTVTDIQNIREIGKRPDVIDLLARSLAPCVGRRRSFLTTGRSIHGHALMKRGLVLMLLGGLEKNLANGTHLRGYALAALKGDVVTGTETLMC